MELIECRATCRPSVCLSFNLFFLNQNSGLWLLSQKIFTGFTSVLLHMLIAITMCGEYGPQRSYFWAPLGPKVSKNSSLWSSSHKFSLVSHQSWFTCQFQLLLEVCWISAQKTQIQGIFDPKIEHGSGLESFLPEASFGLRVLSLPASVCVCICVCGNHLLVRAITCHPFKLESINLDQGVN